MKTNVCLILVLFLSPVLYSAEDKLTIGVKEAAPFAMKVDGKWTGISIDLWRSMADELHLEYEFEERDLKGLISGLEDGSLDASVAALTVTDAREKKIDFTHPFHTSGLGIAVPFEKESSVVSVVKNLFTASFAKALGILLVCLFIPACLFWVFEAKENKQIGYGAQGLANSYWWSAVTMTTVGYGDKVPVTSGGKIVAGIWMFMSIILIAGLTGAIASIATRAQMNSSINGPEDLARARVCTVAESTAEKYLDVRSISYEKEIFLSNGFHGLAKHEHDAVVYDIPIMRYWAKKLKKVYGIEVMILPDLLVKQDYAIGLPSGSELREPLNRVLIREVSSDHWKKVISYYLGQ